MKLKMLMAKLVPMACRLCRFVTVEPIMFLYSATITTVFISLSTGVYQKVCLQLFSLNPLVNCADLNATRWAELQVQTVTGQWTVLTFMAFLLPLFFVGPIWGAVGDHYGRQLNILVATAGILLFCLIYLIELELVHMWIGWIPITGMFISLTGFLATVPTSCSSYITDRNFDGDFLTLHFMILAVVSEVASIIMSFSLTAMFQRMSFPRVLMVGVVFMSVSFFYTLVVIKQVRPHRWVKTPRALKSHPQLNKLAESAAAEVPVADDSNLTIKDLATTFFRLLKGTWETFTKPREGKYRGYIYATVFAFFFLCTTTAGIGPIEKLFVLKSPISWDKSDVARFNGYTKVITLFGTVISVSAMKVLKFHETSILLLCIASQLGRLILTGLATNTAWMYAAGGVGMAGGLSLPVVSGFLAQLIDTAELGRIYSLVAIALQAALIVSQTAFVRIYTSTLEIHAGIVFFAISFLLLISFALILWVAIDFKRYRLAKEVKNEEMKNGQQSPISRSKV